MATRGSVVAVLGWRPAAQLKENVRFVERAEQEGRLRPRDWRGGTTKFRSLALSADGSCELSVQSPAAMGRRLGFVVAEKGARNARMSRRG